MAVIFLLAQACPDFPANMNAQTPGSSILHLSLSLSRLLSLVSNTAKPRPHHRSVNRT